MTALQGLCPVLLVSVLLLLSSVDGFCPNSQKTTSVPSLLFSEASSRDNTVVSDGVSRRDLFAVSLGSIAVASGWKWQSDSTRSLLTTTTAVTTTNNRQILTSVEEALAVIDAQCDRRFLHALVATDYQLLYRSVDSRPESKQASTVTLDAASNTSSQLAPKGAEFRAALAAPSTSLVEDFAGTTPFHLTVTNRQAVGSKAMSLWPLGDNVHFAWPEQEQDLLWSKSRGGSLMANSIIVDGVDCGVMSLEDALERPKGQVMVHSNSFLLVPTAMEQELISRLKESFII